MASPFPGSVTLGRSLCPFELQRGMPLLMPLPLPPAAVAATTARTPGVAENAFKRGAFERLGLTGQRRVHCTKLRSEQARGLPLRLFPFPPCKQTGKWPIPFRTSTTWVPAEFCSSGAVYLASLKNLLRRRIPPFPGFREGRLFYQLIHVRANKPHSQLEEDADILCLHCFYREKN